MADYTDYNEGFGGKGVIAAILVIGAIILAVIFFGPAATVSTDGPALTEPAGTLETAPAADPAGVAPATD